MKLLNARIKKLLTASMGLGALMLPAISAAAPGNLANTPLFTENPVNPNIIMGIDDSGSMDGEVLLQTNDGALWWNVNEQTFVGWLGEPGNDNRGTATPGLPNFNIRGSANAAWKKYVYLFPNGTGTGNRIYSDSTNDHYAIPPLPQYAFMRSPDYNSAFYDPDITYEPWVSYSDGGTPVNFGDISDFANVPSDPVRGSATFNLTSNIESSGTNRTFRMYEGMVIPKGTYYHDGTWKTATSDITLNSTQNIGIRYNPAVYYRKTTSGKYQIINDSNNNESGDCSTPSLDHYRFFEDRPDSFKPIGASSINALGPDGACLVETTLAAGSAEMTNYANWFGYYRKRHLAMRAGVSRAFEDIGGVYTGLFTINNRVNVTMLDLDSQKDAFYDTLYGFVGSGGTPNRTALDHAGRQYRRTDANAPIIAECQKNFTIFFTDGFSTTGGPSVGNVDGDNGSPYADTISNSLADIAMNYYENNLNTNFTTGQVPVSNQCDAIPVDEQLDCNKDLHMVTYTVGLGAQGTIFNNTVNGNFYDEVADVYTNPVTWPDVNSARDPRQIDDLYHAAVNGRGEMLNAATPADLEIAMKDALTSITEQLGSAASVAFNTSVLSTGSVVYQARFNTDKWKGELLSFDLNASTGDVALSPTWDAAEHIPVANERRIFTYNPDIGQNKGVQFIAGTNTDLSDSPISTTAKADLNVDLPTVTGISPAELTAKDRLNYLRGDRTYEGVDNNGKARFRTRHEDSVLGDIVHSAPLFVGDAVLNWPTGDGATAGDFPGGVNSYETWSASLSRPSMVYVGANDGMLHGFDAGTGAEKLAYIPSMLFSDAANDGLHHLSEPDYVHQFYVDNTPSRSDAYIKGRSQLGTATSRDWRSIIVGTLRGGGKGVFALDVTNPAAFSNSAESAASTVLWEFDSTDDADLGLTFSRPTIVPTNATDGVHIRWAAIFGNGYNSVDGDCHAQLFVLFLDGGLDGTWTEGTDYLKMDTNVGSAVDCNGLSTPAVVDLNADGKADAAYAGDLHGNMWNFDLCNKDNQGACQGTGWGVAYSSGNGVNTAPAPVFTATDANGNRQPVTAAPIVISHPTILSDGLAGPNTMILFGTGQYIADGDQTAAAPPSHSYYGIWDRGDASLDRSRLMAQVFESGFGANADFRITGLSVPDYEDNNANGREYGWLLDLPDTSADGAPERVVTNSVVIGDIVFFNTLVPTTNGCDIGGYGYLMSVETVNGGRPESSIIDTDGNGGINDNDLKDVGGVNSAVVGLRTNQGILSEPAFLGDKRYESTSKGTIIKDEVNPGGLVQTGRFSWSEIRNE